MLDHEGQVKPRAAAARRSQPTPTDDDLPRRFADFATMTEALDYAAQGKQGPQFPRCARHAGARLSLSPSCARTRSRAAHRLIARGVKPGDRVALIAETARRVRRPVLRRALCRRLAGAAAAADLVRRPRRLYRPARRAAEQLRSRAAALSARARRHGRRRRRRRPASRASTGPSFAAADGAGRAAARAPGPTTSPICNIRAARPASRTASSITHRALLSNLAAHAHSMKHRRGRPRRLLAAFLPRHGPGRLPALAGRQPDVGRLSQDRGFRPPPARLARPDQPQPRARR